MLKLDMKTRIHSAHVSSVILNACWSHNMEIFVEEIRVYSLGHCIF